MSSRVYIFIDAENHFVRSQEAAKRVTGQRHGLEAIACHHYKESIAVSSWPTTRSTKHYLWDTAIQLYWDCGFPINNQITSDGIERAIYVGSFAGSAEARHKMRVQLRTHFFEPVIIDEPKNNQKRRENQRNTDGLMDKANGCDVTLATRMVADAAADLYDYCWLFTSDVDFLPAIEAVRRMGKKVWVFGYASALGKNSPYDYNPDRFIDLEKNLKKVWNGRYNEALIESLTRIVDAKGVV